MSQDTQNALPFASILGKKVEADFDGGNLTTDGGAMFLRLVESKVGIIDRIVSCLPDRRHASYVVAPHSIVVGWNG